MSLDHNRLSLELLSFVQAWTDDPANPPGGAVIIYPEILADMPSIDSLGGADPWNADIIFRAARELIDQGYMTGVVSYGGQIDAARLTAQGREKILELKERIEQMENPQRLIGLPPDPPWYKGVMRSGLKVGKWILVIAVPSLFGFVVLLATELLSPQKFCPYLPEQMYVWLKPCENVAKENNQ